MKIRIAGTGDADALLAIYRPYVEQTAITFEYEVPSAEEFADRISNTLKKYPYLVAEADGVPVGYAYASAFKPRAAYDWSVETSIYVRQDCTGQGVGRLLYTELEAYLCRQHICNVCACIAWPNPQSVAFHQSFGYRKVAHFTASGFKQNAWYDMIWMEKVLCPHAVPPAPFIPFPALT